jgi:DNA-binding CsgD family transcriptional regulator
MVQKYVGIDPQQWWGWSLVEMFGEGVKSYMTFIHPEDLIIHKRVNHLLLETLADCSYEEKHNLRIVLNFRLRKSDGSYVQISQLSRVLELDADENIQTLLVLLHENNYLSDPLKFFIRFWGISRKEKLYEYRMANDELIELGLPTKREMEIIRLLNSGQDSQQIAEQLFISKNTADTHRRRILQKLCLKSTSELTHLVSITRLLDNY